MCMTTSQKPMGPPRALYQATTNEHGYSQSRPALQWAGRRYTIASSLMVSVISNSIGYTLGWGHFHITDDLFAQMRDYLRLSNHPYADKHRFGQGPNWRMRTIRTALGQLGINESVLYHGIQREVFFSSLAKNAHKILATGKGRPDLSTLKSVAEISELARIRWIEPRAGRRDDFKHWRREGIVRLINGEVIAPLTRKVA